MSIKIYEDDSLSGKCIDDSLEEFLVPEPMSCLSRCQSDPDCGWYTFDKIRNVCTLASGCAELETESCQSCVHGEVQCQIPGHELYMDQL